MLRIGEFLWKGIDKREEIFCWFVYVLGTSGVSAFLNKAADGLVGGGQEEVFSLLPSLIFQYFVILFCFSFSQVYRFL